MEPSTPYHDGERAVQRQAGKRANADINGRVIGPSIPAPALGFIRQQSMAAIATVDHAQRPWASLLFGAPGFLHPESTRRIVVARARTWSHASDPLWANLRHDKRMGMLVIELATRRRLRVNGAASLDDAGLTLEVQEAYPNCPKYIQRRHLVPPLSPRQAPPTSSLRGHALSAEQCALVRQADTIFVASHHPAGGADASHRGGSAGFVHLLDARTLRIPDYPGNNMFNTLGNFAVHPAGGILVPDFQRLRTLQLVGTVTLRWDEDDSRHATGGTRRFWDFAIEETLELPMPVEAAWELLDASPFNP